VGIGFVVGFLAVFFGGGTLTALLLCASGGDTDRRLHESFEAETAELEREANELVLQ
jgi:hypothetical protein